MSAIVTQAPGMIDPVHFGLGWQGAPTAAGPFPTFPYYAPASMFTGRFDYRGATYCVLRGNTPPPPVDPGGGLYYASANYPLLVLRSFDNGVTWSSQDEAHRPFFHNPITWRCPSGVVWTFSGNRIVYSMLVVGEMLDLPPTPPYQQHTAYLVVGVFDLDTNTFGPFSYFDTGWPSYGGPPGGATNAAAIAIPIVFPNGSILLFGADQADYGAGPPPIPTEGDGRLYVLPWTAGSFGALLDITPAGWTQPFVPWIVASALDTHGVCHVIVRRDTTGGESYWYFQLRSNGSRTTPQPIVSAVHTSQIEFGQPAFDGNSWIVPAASATPALSVFRIAPITSLAPVIGEEPIAGSLNPIRPAALAVPGGVVLAWIDGTFSPTALFYSIYTAGAWSMAAKITDWSDPALPAGAFWAGQFQTLSTARLANGDIGVITGGPVEDLSVPYFDAAGVYLAFRLSELPVPPRLPPKGRSGGSKQLPGVGQSPRCYRNQFDFCLERFVLTIAYLEKRLCRLHQNSQVEDYTRPPSQAPRFSRDVTLAAPDPVAGDVLVGEIHVPLGYDAALRAIAHYFTGPWSQGSGDLIFRYKVGRVYAKGLGNVTLQLGSTARPFPLMGAMLVRSLNKIQVYVANTNAIAIPPGVDRVICRLEGWFYPNAFNANPIK